MKDFIEYLVKAIVKHPDEVTVTQEDIEGNQVFTINVNNEDMGLVIGKQGRTIRSIRDLTKAKAIKENVRMRIELHEEVETQPQE